MDSTAEELWESMTPAQRELSDILTGCCNCPYYDMNGILCPPCSEQGRGRYIGDCVWSDLEGQPSGE